MFFVVLFCSGLRRTALRNLLHLSTKWIQFLCCSQTKQENKSQPKLSLDSNLGLLGGKQECYLCATQPPPFNHTNVSLG